MEKAVIAAYRNVGPKKQPFCKNRRFFSESHEKEIMVNSFWRI
jgi:hypothetical protein